MILITYRHACALFLLFVYLCIYLGLYNQRKNIDTSRKHTASDVDPTCRSDLYGLCPKYTTQRAVGPYLFGVYNENTMLYRRYLCETRPCP